MRLIHPFKHRFSLDYETRSATDIKTAGMHKYVADPKFKVLMMSYAMDDEPVKLYECYDRQLPRWFVKDILPDPTILKTAYNAPFEIHSTEAELGITLDRRQWQCTRIMAGMAGYPMNLKETAKAMKLDTLKDSRGTQLITLFTQPAKERDKKRNGGHDWNYPEYFPEQWEEFCQYCIQDTVVERNILRHPTVADMPDMPVDEREYWLLDQRINDRGIGIDLDLVKAVIEIHDEHIGKLVREGTHLTGLDNVKSDAQLKAWLHSNDCLIPNMQKDTVMEMLGHPKLSGRVKRILEIRTETSKSSMTKYNAMVNCCHRLNRVYGGSQFYGANRTGRNAGRIVNTLNMVKNKLKKEKLAQARELVRAKMSKTLALLFGKLSFVLSQLTRTVFIPKLGHKFVISDFASIESRVGGYLAGAEWKLKAFREGKDIYLVNASAMYGLPYEELDWPKEKGKHPLREPAKVGELACQYGSGEPGMIAGGALKSGQLKETDLPDIKKKWRKINPETVQAWEDLETAARDAIADPGGIYPCLGGKIKYMVQHGNLLCKLPSGRTLSYVNVDVKMVTRENGFYDPSKLVKWIEEKLEVKLPNFLWMIWTDEDFEPSKNQVKDLVDFIDHEFGKEVPWFIQTKYTQKVRTTEAIVYEGMQEKGKGQRVWGIADTWGGKFFENVVQAVSRDILFHAMLNLDDEGIDTVLHVYDETVNEVPMHVSVEEVNRIMEIPVPWAPEIPLKAEGFESLFYLKE